MPVSYSPYTMSLAAETTIYQNEVRCLLNENEFNYTLNNSSSNEDSIVNVSGILRTRNKR